jgi:uncharacterized membrane protein
MCRSPLTLGLALALTSGFAFAASSPPASLSATAATEGALAQLWIERSAFAIEALAVALIVVFITLATLTWVYHIAARREPQLEYYERYRRRLGRSLLLGLEILVAADIVRTVALQTTLLTILELGLLVLIRTFLSWSIVVEMEGRWPWQSRPVATQNQHI